MTEPVDPATPVKSRPSAAGLVISTAFIGALVGPLALGVFRGSSLGFLLGFAVTLALFGALQAHSTHAGRTGRPAAVQDDSRDP